MVSYRGAHAAVQGMGGAAGTLRFLAQNYPVLARVGVYGAFPVAMGVSLGVATYNTLKWLDLWPGTRRYYYAPAQPERQFNTEGWDLKIACGGKPNGMNYYPVNVAAACYTLQAVAPVPLGSPNTNNWPCAMIWKPDPTFPLTRYATYELYWSNTGEPDPAYGPRWVGVGAAAPPLRRAAATPLFLRPGEAYPLERPLPINGSAARRAARAALFREIAPGVHHPGIPVPTPGRPALASGAGSIPLPPPVFPYGKYKYGGGNVVVTPNHQYRPARKNEKERKFIVAPSSRSPLGIALNLATEGKDIIDAIWKALPRQYREGWRNPRLDTKARLIYKHYDKVNFQQMFDNIQDAFTEDIGYGKFGSFAGKANQGLGTATLPSLPRF